MRNTPLYTLGYLGAKLWLPFLVMTVIAAIGASIFAIASYSIQRDHVLTLQEEIANGVSINVSSHMEGVTSYLSHTARYLNPEEMSKKEMEDALSDLLQRSNFFVELSLINSYGVEFVKVTEEGPTINYYDRRGFGGFYEGFEGKDYLGAIAISHNGVPYTYVSVPVRKESGEVEAVLAAMVDLTPLWDMVSNISAGKEGYVYIVGSHGHILPDREVADLENKIYTDYIEGVAHLMKGEYGTYRYIGLNGQEVIGTSRPLSDTPWSIITETPYAEAYRVPNLFAVGGILTLAAVIVASAIMWGYITTQVIRPITALREGAARFGGGELDYRIRIKTGDEIEELANEFNSMASNLQDSQGKAALLYKEAQDRVREISSLAEMSRAITSLDLDEVLEVLAREAAHAVVAKGCVIYTLEENGSQMLSPQAVWHVPEMECMPVPVMMGEGIVGEAAKESSLFVAYDMESVSVLLRTECTHEAAMALPLKIAGQVMGVLMVVDKQDGGTFTSREEKLLQAFADQAAIALQNAQLFSEMQRNITELSILYETTTAMSSTMDLEKLLNTIAEQMIKAVGVDECSISEWDREKDEVQVIAELAPDGAIDDLPIFKLSEYLPTAHVLHTGEPVVIHVNDPDADPAEKRLLTQYGLQTVLILPVSAHDETIGIIELFDDDIRDFDEGEMMLGRAIASQAAIALQNVRSYDYAGKSLQERIVELMGLQRVSQEINSTLELDRILNIVLEEAMHSTSADFGELDIYEIYDRRLTPRAWRGYSPEEVARMQNMEFRADMGVLGRVLSTRRPVIVGDVRDDPDYVPVCERTLSEIAIPIVYADEVVGIINLESKRPGFFGSEKIFYLEALANHAAIAIRNAQNYEEMAKQRLLLRQRAEQLERLSAISHAFRSDQPLETVLEDIVFAVNDTVGYNVVMLNLVKGRTPSLHLVAAAGLPLVEIERGKQSPQSLDFALDMMRPCFRLSRSYFVPRQYRQKWDAEDKVMFTSGVVGCENYDMEDHRAAVDNRWQEGDLLITPMLGLTGSLIGLMVLDTPHDGKIPSVQRAETLEIFASQTASAVEDTELFHKEKMRRQMADTLREVAAAVSSTLNLEEVISVVLSRLRDVIKYDSATVHLLEGGRMVVVDQRGFDDVPGIKGLVLEVNEGNPATMVVQTRAPHIVPDVQADYPAFREQPHNRTLSWLGVPLIYGDEMLGIIALDSNQLDYYTEEDAQLALAFADQVAVAIKNARLFEASERQVRELNILNRSGHSMSVTLGLDDLLESVYLHAKELVRVHNFYIAFYDEEEDEVYFPFHRGGRNETWKPRKSGNGLTEYVIRTRQPLLLTGDVVGKLKEIGVDAIGTTAFSWLGVPMIVGEKVLGVICVQDYEHSDVYGEHDRDLLATMASQAAVAFANVRLLEDARRRATEMRYLYDLGVASSGTLDVQEVMSIVASNVLRLTGTHISLVSAYDEPSAGYLLAMAEDTRGDSILDGLLVERLRESELLDMVRNSKGPIVANDMELEEYTVLGDTRGVKSMAGVPIIIQGESSGALMVYSRERRTFDDQDIRLLMFVANQTGVAIRNAQLYENVRRLSQELEQRVEERTEELARTLENLTQERDRVQMLYRISRELSASLDLDRVLVEALLLINHAVGVSHGSILLLDPATDELIYRAALGRDNPLPRGGEVTPYKRGVGLAGWVVSSREPVIIRDLADDERWIPSGDENDIRTSAIAVPLLKRDDVLGVLLLFHPERGYFTENHLELVTAAAAQVATAVNNSELYRLITDQAERLGLMLRAQQAEVSKNKAIVEGIADGVLVISSNESIILINPAASQILGIEASTLENKPLETMLGQPQDDTDQELTELFYMYLLSGITQIGQEPQTVEFRVEVEGKSIVSNVSPVELGSSDEPGFVAVIRDISREAEIERMKNEFISTVSHELRTPMTSIKGYTDLLVSEQVGELSQMQKNFLNVIKTNADRLTALVNDILDISRIETGRMELHIEELNLGDIIGEQVDSFEGKRVEKNMELLVDVPEDLPQVYGDRVRVGQIMENLLSNAWKYSPRDSRIIVRAAPHNEGFMCVEVEDSGYGIGEEDIGRIFDRFYRADSQLIQEEGGTGLGLAIVRTFVEMLGGDIWVESELGKGSIFSFTLPLFKPDEPEQTESEIVVFRGVRQ